jgi:hypothetical protein
MYIININYKYTNAYVVIIFHACCRNKRKEINLKIVIKMSFILKSTSNNPNPIKFKKEIEILEETTSFGQYNNNNYPIPFKKEQTDDNNTNTVDYHYHSNFERIIQLELENESLKSKINDLNETIIVQSNEITDLKLRLNNYEPEYNYYMPTPDIGTDSSQNENETTSDNNQSEETIFNLEIESNHLMSKSESDNDSDQNDDDETSNNVLKIIYYIYN